jgi:hypothetical protein
MAGKNITEKTIDNFVNAQDFPGAFLNPAYHRHISGSIIKELLGKYGPQKVTKLVEKSKPYLTYDRQVVGRMALEEGIDLVIQSVGASFSDEVPLYRGALREKTEYERMKSRGTLEELAEKEVTIKHPHIRKDSEYNTYLSVLMEYMRRWDLKGTVKGMEGRSGERLIVQGYSICVQGFLKNLETAWGGWISGIKAKNRKVEEVYACIGIF